MDQGTDDARLLDELQAWFAEWAADHPQHSESETWEAAKAKFPAQIITRQVIRELRKAPGGIRGAAARSRARATRNTRDACTVIRQFADYICQSAGQLAKWLAFGGLQ
jgi:hypothetical protein